MGLISSIRAALGLADPKSSTEDDSQRGSLQSRRPIPHLPPPPAPLKPSSRQTAPQSAEQNQYTARAEQGDNNVVRTFPGLRDTLGPLPLTKEMIANVVQPGTPGHFLIGSLHESGGVIPIRIGRSGDNLYTELERSIGEASHFLAHADSNAKDAFSGECMLYHHFGKQFGMKHPMRNYQERWGCPKCGIFNPGP